MPHELFVPLGARAYVPLQFNYPQALSAGYTDVMPAPEGVGVEVTGESVNAEIKDCGVLINGIAIGTSLVRVKTVDGAFDETNVTVDVPKPNAVSMHVDGAQYDLSGVKAPDAPEPAAKASDMPAQPQPEPQPEPEQHPDADKAPLYAPGAGEEQHAEA